MDAKAEAKAFQHFKAMAKHQILNLISHRFSTVRQADQIAVLDQCRIIKLGSHDELITLGGQYAR